MTTQQRLIVPLLLTGTDALIFTAPVGRRAIITKAVCCNTDGLSAHYPIFYVVPAGGTADATNKITPLALPIGEDSEIFELEDICLEPGDTLWGYADTTLVLNFHLHGKYVDM